MTATSESHTTVTHEHEHEHEHGTEVIATASVAIDIGDGFGALVIYPSEPYRHREIEISAVDGHDHRVHTGVHERTTFSGKTQLTAVFGSLASGDYLIWTDETTEGPVVTVSDATVAEIALS